MIITITISYQFQTLIQRIDPEFYYGSRGMVYRVLFLKHIKKRHFQIIEISKTRIFPIQK